MMNIIDIFNRRKKTNNKIKLLDLLGFETDITIETSTYQQQESEITFEEEVTFETLVDIEVPQAEQQRFETTNDDFLFSDKLDTTPTDTFNPLNITQQIQKVWTDLETRRKWFIPTLMAAIFMTSAFLGINAYSNYQTEQVIIEEETNTITSNSNNLIELLPTLIEISTNTFYSKYDVSNASANLQQIESSLIEYRTNLSTRDDVNFDEVNNNLNDIFQLVNDLDLVISYRILNSEVLIYNELPTKEEDVDINAITLELSNIVAVSKVNYDQLPDLEEFKNHKNLVNIAISTAEDLHGRYLGALRNNEYDVAASIATAIYLNKETELDAFKKSLSEFNDNALLIYDNFSDLP